ncbi:hypothetical protein ACP8Y2_21785 [Herpetosiphon llansteffanensis]
MPEMTTYERGLQIYQVLMSFAYQRQTLTYTTLGKLVGLPQHGLAMHLDHLLRYCKNQALPPITILVVRQVEGTPSTGFPSATMDLDQERERVFEYPWFRQKPLTIETLKALA